MKSGEQRDKGAARRTPSSDRAPHSSQKPTLAGIRNSSSHPPKRITKSGLAPPPATDSDPPPPVVESETGPPRDFRPASSSDLDERDAASRERISHTRDRDDFFSGERGSYPPRPAPISIASQPKGSEARALEDGRRTEPAEDFEADPTGEFDRDLETMPEIPRPPALAPDHQAMIAASEEATPTDREGLVRLARRELKKLQKVAERANYKTVPGGGENRISGGRDMAAAYLRPGTLRPSRGRVGTSAGIKLDAEVIREARTYHTEPSLLVRRATSVPPPLPDGYGSGPSNLRLIVIVVGALALGAGAMWAVLRPLAPEEPLQAVVPEEPPERNAFKARNEGRERPSQEVEGGKAIESLSPSPAEPPIVAPAPRVRAIPQEPQKASQQSEKKLKPEEAPVPPRAAPKTEPEEPWLE